MGVSGFLRLLSFWVSFYLFFTLSFKGLMAEDSRKPPPPTSINGNNATSSNPSHPPPPPSSIPKSNLAPFKPSIAVIVGVLTTMFSITFLLLLYAKHCKRNNGVNGYTGNPNSGASGAGGRRNSGIDRSVIESLPIFRFGSLQGQKEGLECAVCLNIFESTEVLRLLPKCKHAFHVECVDTWLDAHSTCPLCRYRVDPEDVLLIEESKLGGEENESPVAVSEAAQKENETQEDYYVIDDIESRGSGSESVTRNESNPSPVPETPGFRRISGRHSSAGEKTSRFLELVVHRPSESGSSSNSRRSLDSASLKRRNESVTVGCFDRGRKDEILLSESMTDNRESFERRFEHRIIVSARSSGFQHRWSDLQPSDLLYLRSEMIITESGRFSLSTTSRPSISWKGQHHRNQNKEEQGKKKMRGEGEDAEEREEGERENIDGNGRHVINSRCMSEITGMSRFSNRTTNKCNDGSGGRGEQEASALKRWLGWASQRNVRPNRTSD